MTRKEKENVVNEVQDEQSLADEIQGDEEHDEVQDEETTLIDKKEMALENNTEVMPIDEKGNNKFLYLDPYKLKPHPKNYEIYGKEPVDEDLVESIRDAGQLEPIIIGDKYRIISGHRRWLALKKIKDDAEEEEKEKVKAICFYKPFTELGELEAIVESNRQRKKNLFQIYKEVKLLDEVYATRARQRQLASLKQGSVVIDLEQRKESKTDAGRTIEKEAAVTGIGKTQLTKLKSIGDRCDKDHDENKENMSLFKNANAIMTELKDNDISIDAAYKKLMLMDIASDTKNPNAPQANALLKEIKSEKLSPNKACEKFKKYLKDKDSQLPKIKPELKPGMYNVIVANPSESDIEEAKGIQITEARDAALFLWASAENMKRRIELMEDWGFKLKSIAVWDKNKPGTGTWFDGAVEFLLLGIKGDLKPPEERSLIIFTALKNMGTYSQPFGKDERPDDYIYEIAEKMFPGQKYQNPFREPKRTGWNNQSTITGSGLDNKHESDTTEAWI